MTDFPIPETALAHHIAALGKTGSGKTSTEKLIIEHVVPEGYRVCVLDPIKSDWWGITSSSDGKKPGLPFFIIGGPKGEIALSPTSGKALGKLVGSGKLPLSVLDMADFEKGGDLQLFFSDFANSLMRHMTGVLYLVIEEAHEFAPKERAGFGNENQAIHFAKKLATAGRSKGIRLIVATQRVQALHNAILGSCETLITHRLTLPADQDPVLKWLKANTDKETHDTIAGELSSLPTGTGWVVSGEARVFERVAFPPISTFDNTKTPDRKSAQVKVKTAAVDSDKLRALLGDTIAELAENDPRVLRGELNKANVALRGVEKERDRLVTQLEAAKARPAVAAKVAPAVPDATALKEAEERGYERALTDMDTALSKLCIVKRGGQKPKRMPPPITAVETGQGAGRRRIEYATPAPPPAAGSFPKAQQAILDSLAWWQAFGHDAPTNEQVAFIAGYSPNGGGYTNPRGALKTAGLVDYPAGGGRVCLTDAGRPFAAPVTDNPSGEVLRARVLEKVKAKAMVAILSVLIDAYPEALTNAECAERAGYSPDGGGYTNPRGALRTLGAISYPSSGMVSAEDWLFPEGTKK